MTALVALPSDVARLIGGQPVGGPIGGGSCRCDHGLVRRVVSQFAQAGGTLSVYSRCFRSFGGIEMGWMLWLVRLAAPGATAILFVMYCVEFWPHAADPLPPFLILTFLFGILTLINYRGVRACMYVRDTYIAVLGAGICMLLITGVNLSGSLRIPDLARHRGCRYAQLAAGP